MQVLGSKDLNEGTFIAPRTIYQPQSHREPILPALGAHTISGAKPCHPPPLSFSFWLLLCTGSAPSSAASEGMFRAMWMVAMGTAGEDHMGVGTARRSSKSIALSPESIFNFWAGCLPCGKQKPRRNTTARRSRCREKDCGKGSKAKLDKHRVMSRHHRQAEADGAVRHDSRSIERSS